MNRVTFTHAFTFKTSNACTRTKFSTTDHGTGCTGIKRKSQRGESRLLLRPIPPDDIKNTTTIAEKLRRSVVIEEHFEFAIRGAHTVKISACAQCMERLPRTSAIQPP